MNPDNTTPDRVIELPVRYDGTNLNIREYPTKWKQARDMAMRMPKDSYPEDTGLDLAHRLFLELGANSGVPYYGLLNADRIG